MSSIWFPYGIAPDSLVGKRTEEFFRQVDNKGYDKELAALVAQGICLDARNHSRGATPLHRAAGMGYADIVKALLAAGAVIEAREKVGQTSLHYAAWTDEGTADLLIAGGAAIEAKDNDGITPLIRSIKSATIATTEYLLAKGANIYVADRSGGNKIEDLIGFLNHGTSRDISRREEKYRHFLTSRQPPASTKEAYKLLSVMPLVDRTVPVDYAGNLRRIFAHAKWQDRSLAVGILTEMQKDGTVSAETAESILVATFPCERNRRSRPRSMGAAI